MINKKVVVAGGGASDILRAVKTADEVYARHGLATEDFVALAGAGYHENTPTNNRAARRGNVASTGTKYLVGLRKHLDNKR